MKHPVFWTLQNDEIMVENTYAETSTTKNISVISPIDCPTLK